LVVVRRVNESLLAIFAREREDSSQYAMTRIFRICESFALWIKLNDKKNISKNKKT
jgi:hypothetical protein